MAIRPPTAMPSAGATPPDGIARVSADPEVVLETSLAWEVGTGPPFTDAPVRRRPITRGTRMRMARPST